MARKNAEDVLTAAAERGNPSRATHGDAHGASDDDKQTIVSFRTTKGVWRRVKSAAFHNEMPVKQVVEDALAAYLPSLEK